MRRASLLCLAVLLAASPAAAQLSRLVVPGDGGPVIAPRGQPSPRLAVRPLPPEAAPVVAGPIFIPAAAAAPLAGPIVALLPIIAAAVLGGTLAGSSDGGSSGPVRTR